MVKTPIPPLDPPRIKRAIPPDASPTPPPPRAPTPTPPTPTPPIPLPPRRGLDLDPVRWRGPGPAGFFNFLDDVQPRVPMADGTWAPLVLEDWQEADLRAALDGGFRTIILCWPKRHGKTLIVALKIVKRFISRANQTIVVVSNSRDQSVGAAFKLVSGIIRHTPLLARLIGPKNVHADRIVFPTLDNVVEALPSNPAALIGRKVSIAQVSELHAARDAATLDAMASSTGDSEEGLVLIDSTVGSRSGPLYRLFGLWERGEDPATFVSYRSYTDLDDALAHSPQWLSRHWLTSRSKQMLPQEFSRYHLNQWSSGSNALFAEVDLDAALAELPHPVPVDTLRTITSGRKVLVGGGLDRAYGFSIHGDQTVVTIVAKVAGDDDEPRYIVLDQEVIKFSGGAGIKRAFLDAHTQYGLAAVGVESYNAQDIYTFLQEKSVPVELIHATSTNQVPMFTELHRIVSERRLQIPKALGPLIAEMRVLECDVEQTTPKFGAAGGHHDDRIYSLGWAIFALRSLELAAYELGAVICNQDERMQSLCYLFDGGHVLPCSDTCQTHREVATMYSQFRSRNLAELPLIDFFRAKVSSRGYRIRRCV